MNPVVIHTDRFSPYGWTARHVATEKGIEFSVADVGRGSPEIQALHPFGKMPVLRHGEIVIYETLAIAHYLDRAFAGPALQPIDCLGQSTVLQWISVVNSYVFPLLNGLVKERFAASQSGEQPNEANIAATLEPLAMQLGLVDRTVRDHRFLVGERLTLADSFLFPLLHFASFTPEGSEALAAVPAARRWLGMMRERPSFAATNPFATPAA